MFHAEERADKEFIKDTFKYDPETGSLTYIATGKKAGYVHNSNGVLYKRINIKGVALLCHRICYFLKTGKFPDGRLDHIDGDGTNNKWCNLRLVGHRENMRNAKLKVTNKTGISGVTWRERWGKMLCASRIGDGKGGKVNLYEGQDFFEACCRRKAAELSLGYHENHGKRR